MSHDSRSPDAPTSAAGDSIILHVPSCVQRFSSRRRILARLRALTRRGGRGAPEPEAAPLRLQVEENPNWPPVDPNLLAGLPEGNEEWEDCSALILEDRHDAEAPAAAVVIQACGEPPTAANTPEERSEDPDAVIIQQLMEDNRDLKAALCRLIRISEQNDAALRLLEEENEELSALVHRLTIGQTQATAADAALVRRRWMPAWGFGWLKRRQVRRCT